MASLVKSRFSAGVTRDQPVLKWSGCADSFLRKIANDFLGLPAGH